MRCIKAGAGVYELDGREEFDSFLGFIVERGFRIEGIVKQFDIYHNEHHDESCPGSFSGSIVYDGDIDLPSKFVIYEKPMLRIARNDLLKVTQEYVASRASVADSSTSEQPV